MDHNQEIKKNKRQKLPLGMEEFQGLREDNCYYVDKTYHIEKLTISPTTDKKKRGFYFLSRPRRFGKSLLLDTMQCLFEGKKDLFKGLHIYDKWDWSEKHPVIRISFGSGGCKTISDIEKIINDKLDIAKEKYKLKSNKNNYISPIKQKKRGLLHRILSYDSSNNLGVDHDRSATDLALEIARVISELKKQTGKRVVVLIDEYDLPILEVLNNSSKAEERYDYLRDIYGTLKENQGNIHFIFITGISMFSKVNLFSKINHLNDISMSSKYATICGYTSHDLETVFASEMASYDLNEIRLWYDGYNWDMNGESERLFCPHSVLMLFENKRYANWWYRDCLPKYMYDFMKKNKIKPLKITKRGINYDLIKSFDVGRPDIYILLFQNGYLTIRNTTDSYGHKHHIFDFPNKEVALCLTKSYHEHLYGLDITPDFESHGPDVRALLLSLDGHRLQKKLHQVISGLHYNSFSPLRFFEYESFYAGLVYALFVSTGWDVSMEEGSYHGRSDLVIKHKNQIFILELKCVLSWTHNPEKVALKALRQIEERKYADKHTSEGSSVYAVAMVFGRLERNVLHIIIDDLDKD